MTPMEQFIEAVKAGRVPGMAWRDARWEIEGREHVHVCYGITIDGVSTVQVDGEHLQWESDHLCAAIRRALTAMGVYWTLRDSALEIMRAETSGHDAIYPEKLFSGDLQGHLAAILFALEAQNENR